MLFFARAHTNIALIKYWGKKDEQLILPMNNSISLTLDAFYTETTLTLHPDLKNDVFFLNGVKQNEKESKKVRHFLELVRKQAQSDIKAEVRSINHVPTAAGLASSASGMAALAGSAALAYNLPTDSIFLSRLARKGSGSASRSIYGGFAEWEKGHDDKSSYAYPLKEHLSDWPLAMIFVIVNDKEKKVSSREGMKRTVQTSPFYKGWLDSVEEDLKQTKKAIKTKDFSLLGKTMEKSALKMHACMLSATPPFTYFSPDTINVMRIVERMREKGIEGYFTMDAGPNVKILVEKQNVHSFLSVLETYFSKDQLVVAFPGKGIELKKEFY